MKDEGMGADRNSALCNNILRLGGELLSPVPWSLQVLNLPCTLEIKSRGGGVGRFPGTAATTRVIERAFMDGWNVGWIDANAGLDVNDSVGHLRAY